MTKKAVVTGASKGLGKVIATYLARSGYDVVITGRDAERLAQAAIEIGGSGRERRVLAITGDVSDAGHREQIAAAVTDGLDVLVNNASELGPTPMPSLAEINSADLLRILDVNLIAPVVLAARLRESLASRRGLVVNISSDAAVGGYEGWGGYGSSKAALDLASKTLSAEFAGRGIGVVAVDPGDMQTDMHQAAFPGEDISDRPSPDVTIPFWAWLFAQEPRAVSGNRYQAQGETWQIGSQDEMEVAS